MKLLKNSGSISPGLKALRKRFVHEFYRRNKLLFSACTLIMVMLAGLDLAISYLLQLIVDVASGGEMRSLISLCITFALMLAFMTVVYIVQREVHPRFIKRALKQYKALAFQEIMKKSAASFASEHTDTYISALTNDVNSIEHNYISQWFTLIMEALTFVGALVMMLLYNPLLTLVAILLSLAPVAASFLCSGKLTQDEKRVSDRSEGFVGTVKDMLNGFSVIKSFKAEREMMKLFSESNSMMEDVKAGRRRTNMLITLFGTFAGLLSQFGVFLFGAYMALSGKGVTVGTIVVFLQLMNYIIHPIGSVPSILANRKAALGLIDKLCGALSKNTRAEGTIQKRALDGHIALSHVNFSFEADKRVLNDLSVNFEKGKSYAIVGASGSGKSTLLSLLMGGYADYEGEIRFDDAEIRDIQSDSLYELVSIVQQNVFIFNSSLIDNITMYREFDQAKLNNALNNSGLSKLMLEKGDDYACGENGSGLSGGERQRVSIARCLLRETPVLLVDEATAALDAHTAFGVASAILDLENITRIVVTHQLEEQLMRRYDCIVFMKAGTVAEMGTFDELMRLRGQFYSLFNLSESA